MLKTCRQRLSGKARRALIQGAVITVVAACASATIGGSLIGRTISSFTLDSLIRSSRSVPEPRVVLVDITEGDYSSIFHRKRPLDPATILEMIRAAVDGGARLVAIDISTEDWPADTSLNLQQNAAVVWAEDFYTQPNRRGVQFILPPLLGKPLPSVRECYGVPALGEEAGVVRWFYSGITIGNSVVPGFVEQIVFRSQHDSCLTEPLNEERRIISFSAQISTETASTLLAEARSRNWKGSHVYDGKILILGGSFHGGADVRETPVGSRSGLDINGQAVASILQGTAHREVSELWAVIGDFLIGMVIVLTGLFGHRAQFAATVITFVLSGFLSLYLFRQYYLFLSLVPICVGIFAHLYLEKRFHLEVIPAVHEVADDASVPTTTRPT